MKTINTDAEDFKKRIIFEVNNSKLPPVIVYYIMKDILHEIDYNYQEVLKKEKTAIDEQDKKE